jgi:hypothetical protein
MVSKTTTQLISLFNQDELAAMMTSMAGYINVKNKQKRSTGIEVQVFNKIVDALLLSNELNAIELSIRSAGPIGCAESNGNTCRNAGRTRTNYIKLKYHYQ